MLKVFGWGALALVSAGLITGWVVWSHSVPCWRCVITPNRTHPDPAPPKYYNVMKILTSVEAHFRAEDSDRNGVKDFWRKDVAGLYALPGPDGKPINLLPLDLALADDHPTSNTSAIGQKAPWRGIWFRAIVHEDEDPRKPDPQRFAFAALPSTFPNHQNQSRVHIVDEYNTIWYSDAPCNLNVMVFPKDPLKAGWLKLD